MTEKVVAKLEKAFQAGLSDREACLFVGISRDALYDYCRDNPDFSDQKELLKKTPAINAKFTMAKAVKKDATMALKYLERKERIEWAPPTVKQDLSVKNETSDMTDDQLNAALAAVEAELSRHEGGD